MSMNLHVSATRAVTVNSTGEQSKQVEYFNLWQTPTDVTYAILETDNPHSAYIKWVLELRNVRTIPRYAPNDFFQEGEIVGYDTYCPEDNHINELATWHKAMTDGGYEIEFYYL